MCHAICFALIAATSCASKTQNSSVFTNILVAYFSCTGTTEKLAKYAADYLNADLCEIQPAEPYTDEDLAYYTNGRADQEQNAPDARTQINSQVEDMSKYQIVVIAYPIWHG